MKPDRIYISHLLQIRAKLLGRPELLSGEGSVPQGTLMSGIVILAVQRLA